MNADVANLILEKVNRIESDVSGIKADISMLKESVRRIDSRIGSIEQIMSGFHTRLQIQSDDIDGLRGRMEHVEDQLKPDPSAE